MFTEVYFEDEAGEYIEDYEEILAEDIDNLYKIEDSWANYDLLKPVLDQRLEAWKKVTR